MPADDVSQWSQSGSETLSVSQAKSEPGKQDGSLVMHLKSITPGEGMSLSHRGKFDLGAIDRVQLRVTCANGTRFFARFLRKGRLLAKTKDALSMHMNSLGELTLKLPPSAMESGVADTFELHISKTAHLVELEAIEFVSTPAASLVPPANGETELAQVGQEARRGVGVSVGRPVEAVFTGPPEGVLGFGLAVPASSRWRGDDPNLVLTLTAEGTPPRVSRYPLTRGPAQSAWRDFRVPLVGLAEKRIRAHFEVEVSPGQDAACIVSEAAVWSRQLKPRPPLLLVTTDTHRADHLGGAVRGVGVETPVLDGLAARGVFFEDCFSTANYTNPSHMALMTGRHPRDLGILSNKQAISGAAETLAESLRNEGYRTFAALSARHLGDPGSGLGQGFDRMAWPDTLQRRSEHTLAIVEQWLDSDDERPLFLWLHVFDAHRPYDPPPELLDRYYDGPADPFDETLPPLPEGIVLPSEMSGLRVLDYPRAQYKALVSHLDQQLARVLDHQRMQEAVVAVVGDHGEEFGDHEVWFDHAELYPDTLHVPLLLAWPGGPEGKRDKRAVSHLDLGRTMLDLLGLDDVSFPGTTLLKTRDGESQDGGKPRFALSSHGSSASITLGGLHLVLHLRKSHRTFEHHQVQLFDLVEDPACLQDLVEDRPAETRALRAQLVHWLGEEPLTTMVGASVDDPQLLSGLAQLGYTGGSTSNEGGLWQQDGCSWCKRLE
ncbi:MAG: sulfatase [Planctomycetota bacterium]|jgi:arylsulfatase A-like enzyme|nr:sulfatase [Planctomycetota bacterium]